MALSSGRRMEYWRFKTPSSSAAAVSSGRAPLAVAFLSCLAWLYIAGRLWQDAQTRMVLSSLLEKNNGDVRISPFPPYAYQDMLRNLGCTEIGRKIAEAEMDLTLRIFVSLCRFWFLDSRWVVWWQ